MRHQLLAGCLLCASLLAPAVARAETSTQSGFSLGLILGDPTGLTLRSVLGDRSAIQAHLGFSPFPGDAVAAIVDWTYDVWDPMSTSSSLSLPIFFGMGGKAQWFSGRYYVYRHDNRNYFSDLWTFGLGLRALIGLRASLREAPIDLFIELAPIGLLVVIPNPGVYYDFDLAVGARFRF